MTQRTSSVAGSVRSVSRGYFYTCRREYTPDTTSTINQSFLIDSSTYVKTKWADDEMGRGGYGLQHAASRALSLSPIGRHDSVWSIYRCHSTISLRNARTCALNARTCALNAMTFALDSRLNLDSDVEYRQTILPTFPRLKSFNASVSIFSANFMKTIRLLLLSKINGT